VETKMLEIILLHNLPYFVILSIPIIISELFFKKDAPFERLKYGLRGFGMIFLIVIAVNILWLVMEFLFAGSMVQYLLSTIYTGNFKPSLEHIIIRTLLLTIQMLPWYILFVFGIIIARDVLKKSTAPIQARNGNNYWENWFNHYFSNETAVYNRGIPMIAVALISLWLAFLIFIGVNNLDIRDIHKLPEFSLRIFSETLRLLFYIFMVLIPYKIVRYRLQDVEDTGSRGYIDETYHKPYFWIFGLITGGTIGIIVLEEFLNELHNFGESIFSGKMLILTLFLMGVFIVIKLLLILVSIIIPLDKFGLEGFSLNKEVKKHAFAFRVFLAVGIVILTSVTVAQPVLTTTPSFFTHQEAFSKIDFAENPIEDFPVNLSYLRLVSSDLARDISKASPASPPKPYSLMIMDDREMVGMIEGRPAWIIPMKYDSQFNPDANVIAGYVRVFLDDPIPESILIKFFEMDYGWGLNGYNDITFVALQAMPDAFIGNDGISFIDPYGTTGEPAWIVKMSKMNEWGLEIPAGVLVIKGDGSYEALTVGEAATFDPEVISDSVFMATADRAGNYIRTNQITGEFEFDFSAKGLFTVPTSPDRFINIGFEIEGADNFYLRPHHYLRNDGNWFGRIYYRKTTTSNIENVVAITVENDTMTMYDLRQYERGGLRGVHTPDDVMDDLEGEFQGFDIKEGELLSRFRIRQPTLYKTRVDNDTVLVWVSLIIYSKQGADELRGALFVDAANTRIAGYTTRSIGEASDIFKQRLISNLEQTYRTFGTDNDTAGETQTAIIENGTISFHDWIGQDGNSWKIYVMRIWDNDEDKEWLVFIRKSEANTGKVYALAASATEGQNYKFSLRFDKDEQVYILYDMSVL
jgi:hypothetical protein